MENSLVAVRDTDEYKRLLDRSWEYAGKIRAKGYDLVVLRWKWGFELASVKTRYGDSFIDLLAEDIEWHRGTLYDYRALGKAFDTEEDLKKYWDDCIRAGIPMNLTKLLRGVAPDPTKRPEQYGGKAQVVDELMREVETLGIKLEKLKGFVDAPELGIDKKREILGVLQKAEEVMSESGQMSPSTTIGVSEDYLDYIRSLPCRICDFNPVDPHHVETGGVGMKGSDFTAIPLCRKHHDELGSKGKETFQQLHGIMLAKEIVAVLVPWCELYVMQED